MAPLRRDEFEALYQRLRKPLYNVLYRWLWNRDEAQDLVQEAFVRLWRMRDRIDPERVEALVYRIGLNLAASRRRRRKVWRYVGIEALHGWVSPRRGAEEEIEADERGARVREAVEALPRKLRDVVVLCECTDLRYDEIARLLSISKGTVGSRRHRALAILKRRLGGEGSEGDGEVRQSV